MLSPLSGQVPDLLHVAAALKGQAAQPSSPVSRSVKTNRQQVSEIWTSVYSAESSTQARIDHFPRSENRSRYHNMLKVL